MNNIFLKSKKYILVISLFILLFYGLTFSCLKAEELSSEKKYIEEYKPYIDLYVTNITTNLKEIDDLVLYMKSQKEYTKYPAVRLNVQTPFLGISAIIENKLQIVDNVSIFDRTQSYSIRDVINKKKLKAPSFSIASIVLLTKDIDIYSKDLTKEELNEILTSLKKYQKQTEDVYRFLEEQKNNIFFDYVSKDIKAKIDEYKNEIITIQNGLLESNDKILLLILSNDENDELQIATLEKNFLDMYDKSLDILEKLSNILIREDELTSVKNEIDKLKKDYDSFNVELNLKYDVETLNLDTNSILINLRNNIQNNILEIETYIKSSSIEKNVDGISKEIITIYDIKNNDVLVDLTKFYEEIEIEINLRNANSLTGEYVGKVHTNEEELLYVTNLTKKYNSLINQIDNFYKENVNVILKTNIDRIQAIIRYTDISVSNYIKVLCFEVPDSIKLLQNKNINSIFNTLKSIEIYRQNLNSILNVTDEIYSIYSEKLKSGEIKS